MLYWLLILCLGGSYGEEDGHYKSYENYIVLNVTPQDELQVGYLVKLSRDPDLDILSGVYSIGETTSILIPPSRRKDVERALKEREIQNSLKIVNVQKLIDKVRKNLKTSNNEHSRVRRQDDLWYFRDFRTPVQVLSHTESMQTMYPDLVSYQDIGTTFEHRDLRILKIGIGNRTDKPIIWIQGGIHAREWITTPAAMYVAYKLVSDYDNDDDIRKLLEHFDWYIMPMMNPDGYRFSVLRDMLWRKNRRRFTEMRHIGVDLNRNFGYKWGEGAAQEDQQPSSVSYQGPTASSEAETQAVSGFLTERKDRLKLFLDFHSYGNKWLTPYGYTMELPVDYPEMERIFSVSNKAIAALNGTLFRLLPAFRMYDKTYSGTTVDWAYGELKCIHSYALELTDDPDGFFPPASSILKLIFDVWPAVKAASMYLMD